MDYGIESKIKDTSDSIKIRCKTPLELIRYLNRGSQRSQRIGLSDVRIDRKWDQTEGKYAGTHRIKNNTKLCCSKKDNSETLRRRNDLWYIFKQITQSKARVLLACKGSQ